MCFFSHKWIKSSAHFISPVDNLFEGHMAEKTLLKLKNGYTVVVMRCVACGDYKTQEILGDATQGLS